MARGVTKFEDPVAEWLKKEYGDYGRATAEYISKLTLKQREFAARYLVHGSPSKAAIEAGFTKAAAAQAHHFVNVPKMAAYLNLLAAKREVDMKRASSAEMLVRIKATATMAADATRTPEAIQKVTKNLTGGVADLSVDELLENIQDSAPDNGVMQIAQVSIPEAVSFGADWVLEQLVRVAERCLQIEAVCDSKGRPIGQFQFNPTQALKALELVGRTLALFTDRIEHTPMEQYDNSELNSRIVELVGEHPELAKIMGKIDAAAIPKPAKKRGAGSIDPDFVEVDHKGNTRKGLVH